MSLNITKKDFITDHLRQLAFEVINNISINAIKIFINGSKIADQDDSGIYIETLLGVNELYFQRNPDYCYLFRSKLTGINVLLEAVLTEKNFGELCIFFRQS